MNAIGPASNWKLLERQSYRVAHRNCSFHPSIQLPHHPRAFRTFDFNNMLLAVAQSRDCHRRVYTKTRYNQWIAVFAQSLLFSFSIITRVETNLLQFLQRAIVLVTRVLLPTRDRYLMCTRSVLFQIEKSRKVTDAIATGKKLNHCLVVWFVLLTLIFRIYINMQIVVDLVLNKTLTFCLLNVGKLSFVPYFDLQNQILGLENLKEICCVYINIKVSIGK